LNYSDGKHSLLDIANKMNTTVTSFRNEVEALQNKGLLKKGNDV